MNSGISAQHLCRNLVTIFGINDVSQLSPFYQSLQFINARKTDTLLSSPKQGCVHRNLSMDGYLSLGVCKLRPSQPNLAFDSLTDQRLSTKGTGLLICSELFFLCLSKAASTAT